MSRVAAAVLLILLLSALSVAAQQTGAAPSGSTSTGGGTSSAASSTQPAAGSGTTASSSTGGAATQEPQPVPYNPADFPLWLRKARRAEVIWIGAFPITLLFSRIGYQVYRYYANGQSQAYAPSIFGTPVTPLTQNERIGVVLGGIGLAGLVALADFIVGEARNPSEP